jgi:hypothetical protein
MMRRAELRIAQGTGRYRERAVEQYPIPRSQYGFLAVALRRALERAEYPERIQWVQDFRAIKNGVDAALFITEVKLKVRYGMDMKRLKREAKEELESRDTLLDRLNIR